LPTAIEGDRRSDETVPAAPEIKLVKWYMAKVHIARSVVSNSDKYWNTVQTDAFGQLWTQKDRLHALRQEMVESSSQDEYKSVLDEVERHYFPRFHNPCHIFDRCKAAIDDGIVKRVPEVKRIVEIVDSENQIFCFVFSKAFQKLMSGKDLDVVDGYFGQSDASPGIPKP
jgi:hypothetical protein